MAALFQSTPGINAGRIGLREELLAAVMEFQSTPGINAGRIVIYETRFSIWCVSIHARH